MKQLCFSTFVFGEKYQDYMPLLIYSLKKSYPDYHIIVFVHKEIKTGVRNQLDVLRAIGTFEIRENFLAEYDLDIAGGRAVRWILWDDSFFNYNAIYFVDIDIMYVKEKPDIYSQHLNHSNLLQLPLSNVLRKPFKRRVFDLKYCLRLIKNGSLRIWLDFVLSGGKIEKRATGLHFVITKPYYEKAMAILNKYKNFVLNKTLFMKKYHFGDEEMLYDILNECGWSEKMPQAESNKIMMDTSTNNIFLRPHHGIHLGIFRSDKDVLSSKDILSLPVYKEYYKKVKEYFSDPLYIEISKYFSGDIKEEIERMKRYFDKND